MKFYKLLFFNSMITGTFIAISANMWLVSWIGLEINLLSFIPLLKNSNNMYPTEAALKYFITQVLGSSLLLTSVVIFYNSTNYLITQFKLLELIILSCALLLKLGAAPFHFWFPEVLSGLNWNNSLILLTWQKIAPMLILSYQIKFNTFFFSMIIIISSLISGIQGLNQICMRKIMAYSSINHLSWMISTLMNSVNLWIYYFLIYCLININILMILKKYNIFYLNQMSTILIFNKNLKFLFILNFLSLGGLPPFIGFLPKWLTINNLIMNKHYLISVILIIFTLISLYFYLRISFSTLTLNSNKSLIILLNKINYSHFFLNCLTLMGLLMCSFLDSFF